MFAAGFAAWRRDECVSGVCGKNLVVRWNVLRLRPPLHSNQNPAGVAVLANAEDVRKGAVEPGRDQDGSWWFLTQWNCKAGGVGQRSQRVPAPKMLRIISFTLQSLTCVF
jgi:hypothetical protein